MKNTCFALLLGSLGLLPFASADELTKSWNVGSQPELRVEAGDASIEISGADTNTIRAKLTTDGYKIGYGGVELIEHQSSNSLDLRVKEPNDHFGWGRHSIHLELVVPKALTGEVKTGDGSIRLSNLGGKLRADSGDGGIDGVGLNGALDAHTGDGSMHLDGAFTDLRLRTGDGSIDLRAGSGSKVNMSWELNSGDGSISVRLPRELPADIELRTGDGHIHSNLPITVSDLRNEHEVHGKLNGGGAPIIIHTGDGSITLDAI